CAVNDDCSYLYICTGQSEFTGDEIFQNGLLSACNTVRSRCIPFMDAAIRPFYCTHQQFPRFIRCQRSNLAVPCCMGQAFIVLKEALEWRWSDVVVSFCYAGYLQNNV